MVHNLVLLLLDDKAYADPIWKDVQIIHQCSSQAGLLMPAELCKQSEISYIKCGPQCESLRKHTHHQCQLHLDKKDGNRHSAHYFLDNLRLHFLYFYSDR
jgi:hypothetical protein